jgi:hypothetical protein
LNTPEAQAQDLEGFSTGFQSKEQRDKTEEDQQKDKNKLIPVKVEHFGLNTPESDLA